jgi:hypothetical protein
MAYATPTYALDHRLTELEKRVAALEDKKEPEAEQEPKKKSKKSEE